MDQSKFIYNEYSKEGKKKVELNHAISRMKKNDWKCPDEWIPDNQGKYDYGFGIEYTEDINNYQNILNWYFNNTDIINNKWNPFIENDKSGLNVNYSFDKIHYQFRKSKNIGRSNFFFLDKLYTICHNYFNENGSEWQLHYYFLGCYIGMMVDRFIVLYDAPKDPKDFAETVCCYTFKEFLDQRTENDIVNYQAVCKFLEFRNSKPIKEIMYIEDNFFSKKLIFQLEYFFQNFKNETVQKELKNNWNRLKNQNAKRDLLSFILMLNKKQVNNNMNEPDYDELENKINLTLIDEIYQKIGYECFCFYKETDYLADMVTKLLKKFK